MKKLILSVCLAVCVCMSVFVSAGANSLHSEQGINVTLDIIEDENLYEGLRIECHGVIQAYKSGKLLWKYVTEQAVMTSEVETISNIYINNNTVYIAVNHILYALDINSGKIKWKISDVGGGNCFEFDGYGNIYISGFYGPDIVVVDKNGKELYREDNPNYSWVDKLEIVGNVLNIVYWDSDGQRLPKTLNISEFRPKEINVVLNGEKIKFDQQPVIQKGRTLVPIRAVVEKMGGSVEWNSSTRTAVLKFSGKIIKLTIDSNVAYLNEEEKELDVAPQIINGRTLLPIRFVAESFGFDVDWNASSQTVIIVTRKDEDNSFNLLDCIGKTKEEIVNIYGEIVATEYWLGGKYYKHNALESLLYYEHNNYNYELNDDVPKYVQCNHIIVKLSELLDTPYKEFYTIAELKNIFGEYEFTDDLNNEYYPLCHYKFTYGNYSITIESDHVNPKVSEAVVYIIDDTFDSFLASEFESTQIKIQSEVYSSIIEDNTYLNSLQRIINYNTIDVDGDGKEELVISSKVLSDNYSYSGSCFSIWDTDDKGKIYCILAKCGQNSRSAYQYSIINYQGDIVLLESAGMSNSVGSSGTKNLYKINNGEVTLFKALYYDTYANEYKVNGVISSSNTVNKEIEEIQNKENILVQQKF